MSYVVRIILIEKLIIMDSSKLFFLKYVTDAAV